MNDTFQVLVVNDGGAFITTDQEPLCDPIPSRAQLDRQREVDGCHLTNCDRQSWCILGSKSVVIAWSRGLLCSRKSTGDYVWFVSKASLGRAPSLNLLITSSLRRTHLMLVAVGHGIAITSYAGRMLSDVLWSWVQIWAWEYPPQLVAESCGRYRADLLWWCLFPTEITSK